MAAAAQPPVLAESAKVMSRPPPVEVERSNGGSIADTFERLLSSELEAGFASMQQPAGAAIARGGAGADLGEVRSLFAQLAANHVRSVRDFVIDLSAKRVQRAGVEVRLTPTQWHLVEVLVHNEGRLVTQRQLLGEVWGPGYSSETHYLRVFMAQIRRKLEPDAAHPVHFLTEPGMGYRFER